MSNHCEGGILPEGVEFAGADEWGDFAPFEDQHARTPSLFTSVARTLERETRGAGGFMLFLSGVAASILYASSLYDQYVTSEDAPRVAQRVTAPDAQAIKLQAQDAAINKKFAAAEVNPLNTPWGKRTLKKAFQVVQEKRSAGYVIVSFSRERAPMPLNAPEETAVLLPPAAELSKAGALLVCVSHAFAEQGHLALRHDSGYVPFSAGKQSLSQTVPFLQVSGYRGGNSCDSVLSNTLPFDKRAQVKKYDTISGILY